MPHIEARCLLRDCIAEYRLSSGCALLPVAPSQMAVSSNRIFSEFQQAAEGIASNILADRLQRLEAGGIVSSEQAAEDGRSTHYRLTAKGVALAPVLLELLIWAAHHEKTDAPCAAIDAMEQNRAAVLAETYRRWEQRDPTPLIPPFDSTKSKKNSPKGKSRK